MGAKGSGRTRESYALQRLAGASKAHRTADTENFYERLKLQAGDRMFSVDRRYSDGQWFTVGVVGDAREESVGGAFGGGVYRVYEVDKAREERTGTPPLTLKLHPGKYPFKEEFVKSPTELEAEAGEDDEDLTKYGIAGGAGAGVDVRELAARIEQTIRRDLERENRVWQLEQQIKMLSERGPVSGGGQVDSLAMIREIAGLMKELAPAPAFGMMGAGQAPPANSLEQLKESFALIKGVQELAGQIPGGAKGNPMLEQLTMRLFSLGEKAITAYQAHRAPVTVNARQAAPAGATRSNAVPFPNGGSLGQPGMQAGPPAPPQPSPEQIERDFQIMVNELSQKLLTDQADQLSDAPKTHISETVGWVRAQWTGDDAPTVWTNLRDMFQKFSDGDVRDFLVFKVPALADTDKKKAWLGSLVELLRKA
jgi:hypothetical protein